MAGRGKNTRKKPAAIGSVDVSRSKRQPAPLKPRNAEPNTAAALFAAISKGKSAAIKKKADDMKNKSAAAKDMDLADGDSGSEQRSSISSDNGQIEGHVAKKLKLEPVDEPVDDAANDVLSSVSSSTSLSTSFRNADVMKYLKRIDGKVDDLAREQAKCLTLAAQTNAKMDQLSSGAKHHHNENEPGPSNEFTLIPVSCLADLEAAEAQCDDYNYVECVIREMGKIHGKNRFKQKGGTVCLQMIDYFVKRRFFLECSWTGISKTVDENQELVPKIAFSKYEKFIGLFYKVVQNADEDFTKEECVKFLKQCLRNSKQRVGEKMQRTSAARNRAKKFPSGSASNIEYIYDTLDNSHEAKTTIEYIEEIIDPRQGSSSTVEHFQRTGDQDQDPPHEDEDLNGLIIEEMEM